MASHGLAGEPFYFAYGSNLNPEQMEERCPGHRVVGRAVLRGHALRFQGFGRDWEGAVATIVRREGSDVHGVVFALTRAHYDALDRYEGRDGENAASNLYDLVPVPVELEDGRTVEALTYVMRPHAEGMPSRRYRGAILLGMRHHGLPAAAIAELEAVAVRD